MLEGFFEVRCCNYGSFFHVGARFASGLVAGMVGWGLRVFVRCGCWNWRFVADEEIAQVGGLSQRDEGRLCEAGGQFVRLVNYVFVLFVDFS